MTTFLAVDWGTTNRRVYRIEDGRVAAVESDDRGVKAMAREDYASEIATMRARFGDLPVLIVGMAGSTIGWHEVPYVAAPASIESLAAGLHHVDARTAIVPGVSRLNEGQGEVMRGEEVQILGALAAGLVPADALVCQPGTHCKWVTLSGGSIVDFTTAMTGELFALLKAHSVLAAQLTHEVRDGAAFAEGVRRGAERDLLAALFGVRAASVLGLRDDSDAASYASGLLIGADVAARRVAGREVHLLAEAALGDLYAHAIEMQGGHALRIDSQTAFVAGAAAIGELCL
jgi:2-dehydro-3-deoxygalactonokinase